ncbi:unknown similar to AMEV109 [Mythimna separata entomopoxvirus 'L']|uniref:Type VII secretion system protein EssD-like domain-containing protein n=2 Tax=Mythimna separata entomopoxvirus TaxID=1179664 RepID=A0A916KQA1_9POXV|nr:unknown similar to AMEV109 [Mythimna separata entomopoxvirus 'L']BAO03247.1 parasitoid killer toxin [Mythimna separata entomopoxvirus]CCU56343.1 unknown similar to AMEV109 [Mythimna separata entomopoxvirus 'L']
MDFLHIFIFFNYILFTNSYSYLSTFEAYIIGGNNLCMGNCLPTSIGEKRCVNSYNGHELECKTTSIVTKKYRTITNVPCFSNCGYFEGELYQWCMIRNGDSWDYCNRLIATKGVISYRTNNKYISCTDECGKHGENYNWCNTIKKNWDYCDPEKKIILFNFRTENNKICVSPCEIYTDGKAYCYDDDFEWKKCYLNPEYKTSLNIINSNTKNNNKPGEYTKNGYKICDTKVKRDLSFTLSSLNVESIAREYEDNNPTVIVRDLDPANIITDDRDPTLSYTVLPTYSYFGNDQINLPLVVRAIITNSTLRNAGERETFNSEIHRHFNNMNPNLNHVNYDERGHIIGSRLGGPTETYNIFPQSWRHNHGRLSRWQYMESDLDNFIRGHSNRYAEYTAILSYETDSNGILNFRPTAIGLRVRLYDNGNLVNMHGNPISSYSANTLENMYFTNDPDYSCIIEGDEIEESFN